MNTTVSSKIAQLLQEKGYDKLIALGDEVTIGETCMWLYEKHKIWIKIDVISINQIIKFYCSYYKITNGFTGLPVQLEGNFNSPTEAYLSAIEYVLNSNLI